MPRSPPTVAAILPPPIGTKPLTAEHGHRHVPSCRTRPRQRPVVPPPPCGGSSVARWMPLAFLAPVPSCRGRVVPCCGPVRVESFHATSRADTHDTATWSSSRRFEELVYRTYGPCRPVGALVCGSGPPECRCARCQTRGSSVGRKPDRATNRIAREACSAPSTPRPTTTPKVRQRRARPTHAARIVDRQMQG
jgi:hypothetical protein